MIGCKNRSSQDLHTIFLALLAISLTILVMALGEVDAEVAWSGEQTVVSQGNRVSIDMAVDRAFVHMVWVVGSSSPQETRIYHTKTGKAGWTTPKVVSTDPGNEQGASPELFASDGVIHMVYVDSTDGDADVMYRTYSDATWGSPQEISTDSGTEDQTNPAIAVVGENIYIVWIDFGDGDGDIYFRQYNGLQWLPEFEVNLDVSGGTQVAPAIVADEAKAHVIWKDGELGAPYIRHRFFDGTSWGGIYLVSDQGGPLDFDLDFAIDDGRLHVVWDEIISGVAQWSVYYRQHDGHQWGDIVKVNETADGFDDFNPSIAVDGDFVFITYETTKGIDPNWPREVYVIWYDGATWSDPVAISEHPGQAFKYSSRVYAHDGRTHFAWLQRPDPRDDEDIRYRFARFDNEDPSSHLTPTTLFWHNNAQVSLGWEATDDYALTNISLHYRHSPDNVTWQEWTEWGYNDAISGSSQTGTFSFDAPQDGFYEFYSRARDVWGRWEVAPAEADVLLAVDTTLPTGSVLIDAGAEWTGDTGVQLTCTFEHALTEALEDDPEMPGLMVRFSNDPTWSDEPWEDAGESKAWTLEDGDGTKTVHYQLKSVSGLVSDTLTDDIVLDTSAPTGSIVINGGALRTNSTTVELNLAFQDDGSGVHRVSLSLVEDFTGQTLHEPLGTMPYEFEEGDGPRTLFCRFVDTYGWVSITYNATIIIDTSLPGIATLEPVDGSEDVNVSSAITIEFSEPMDPASLETAFRLLSGANLVLGALSLDEQNTTMTFEPNADLDPGRNYTISIGPGAKDLAGNQIGSEVSFSFTTATEDGNGGNGGDGDGGSIWPWLLLLIIVIIVVGAVILIQQRHQSPRTPSEDEES